MKRFYFYIQYGRALKYGGCNAKARVFGLSKNGLKYLLTCEWCTSSSSGERSEVFRALIENKYIPKKWYKSSLTEWSGAGYYYGPVTKKYLIEEL